MRDRLSMLALRDRLCAFEDIFPPIPIEAQARTANTVLSPIALLTQPPRPEHAHPVAVSDGRDRSNSTRSMIVHDEIEASQLHSANHHHGAISNEDNDDEESEDGDDDDDDDDDVNNTIAHNASLFQTPTTRHLTDATHGPLFGSVSSNASYELYRAAPAPKSTPNMPPLIEIDSADRNQPPVPVQIGFMPLSPLMPRSPLSSRTTRPTIELDDVSRFVLCAVFVVSCLLESEFGVGACFRASCPSKAKNQTGKHRYHTIYPGGWLMMTPISPSSSTRRLNWSKKTSILSLITETFTTDDDNETNDTY